MTVLQEALVEMENLFDLYWNAWMCKKKKGDATFAPMTIAPAMISPTTKF